MVVGSAPRCWRAGEERAHPIRERPCLTNWVERAEGEAKLFNKLIAPIYFIFYLFCLLSAGNYCFWFLTEYISNNQDICPSSTACLTDRQKLTDRTSLCSFSFLLSPESEFGQTLFQHTLSFLAEYLFVWLLFINFLPFIRPSWFV